MKNIKKGERLKFFVLHFLALPLVYGGLSAIAGLTPLGGKKYSYNFTAMYIALGVSTVFWLSVVLYRFSNKKTLWSWLFFLVVAVTLWPATLGIAALNWVYAAFPTWVVIVPLATMYLAAVLLPLINEKLAATLHNEWFAPRSCLGTIIYMSIMSLAPIAGIFGAFLSGLAERSGGVMGYAMMGLFFHIFWVWQTISAVYQAWEQRPWRQAGKE